MNVNIVVVFFLLWVIILYGFPALYFKKGWFRKWYHDVLKWHYPDSSIRWYDGCSFHAKCKHCGKEIMQDSQGNWF